MNNNSSAKATSPKKETKELPKKSKLFGVHIGFGKKKKEKPKEESSTSISSTNSVASKASTGTSKSKTQGISKTSFGDLNAIVNFNDDDMAGIVKEDVLQEIKQQHAFSVLSVHESQYLDTLSDEDDDVSREELFVSDFTREWMRLDDVRERRSRLEKKAISVADTFPSIAVTSSQSIARPISDRQDISTKAGWIAPDSWVVSGEGGSKSSLPKSRNLVDDQMSCIRVFKREGNFVTVSCSMSVSAKDLCSVLSRKFFIQPDISGKFQLWLARRGCEILMEPNDRPLRIQQQLLYEVGYEQDTDKYPEILREDNSYLFRWVFSDIGIFNQNYSTMVTQCQINPALKLSLVPTVADQKLIDLVKMSSEEVPVPSSIDLSALNLESIPPIMFKYAKSINSMTLAFNLMLDIPQDFAQLCINLTFLNLSSLQLQRIPRALSLITSLKTLNLSTNHITTLKDSGLQSLKKLKSANFSNNRFLSKNSITIEVVSFWQSLEILDLSCNWIRGECPPSLLYIGACIKVMPESPDSLPFSNPLKELDLSYNLIKTVPADFARRLAGLQKLWLVSNNLSGLPNDFTDAMTNLEIFDLRGNQIRSVPGIADNVDVSLDGQKNSVSSPLTSSPTSTTIPGNKFANDDYSESRPLTKLFFDNNQISNIRISARFPNLTTVVSHRNQNLLQVSFLSVLPTLTTLIISSSKLAFLPDEIFGWAPNITSLVLNHNQITSLPLSLAYLKQLVNLELAHNSITKIPSFIKELKSLELLDVRGNNLKEVPSEIWDLKLKYLNLSSNVIEILPENPFLQNLTDTVTRQSFSSGHTSAGPKPSTTSSSGLPTLPETRRLEDYLTRSEMMVITEDHEARAAHVLPAPLATCLQWLSVADNRLESSFFDTTVCQMLALKHLNASYNDIFNIPSGSFRHCASTIEEIYLSGNHLTQLPEELHTFKSLHRLYLNNNRLGSLPPELGKIPNLRVLDVGRNQLRYNVTNWPYDWNWNWNSELRSLNLSGNPRLEIRPMAATPSAQAIKKEKLKDKTEGISENVEKGDISRFDSLSKIRVLGLMEVSLSVPVPDETRGRRVRVNALGGASAHWKKQIGMDSVAVSESPAAVNKISDLTGSPNFNSGAVISSAVVVGPTAGTPISTTPGENSLNVVPVVAYGISDNLGVHEKMSVWDLVILGQKFFQTAKEEARPIGEGGDTTNIKNMKKQKAGECVFGLFDGGNFGANWCGKYLYDSFVARFSIELKKVTKERQSKRVKDKGGVDTEPELSDSFAKASDSSLIQHALRRTFLSINKQLGDLAWKTEYKPKDGKEQNASDDTGKSKKPNDPADPDKRRKYSVSFETPLQGKIKKGKQKSTATAGEDAAPKNPQRRKVSMADANLDSYRVQEIMKLQGIDENSHKSSTHDEYWDTSESEDEVGEDELTEDAYIGLAEFGHSGIIAYLVNSQLFVANCGDSMTVLSRGGVAVPVSMKHTLFSFQASNSNKPRVEEQNPESRDNTIIKIKRDTPEEKAPKKEVLPDKEKLAAKEEAQNANLAKKELHRIRETGAYVSHDGLVCQKTILSRAFGFFHLLPHVNAAPYISVTDVTDQDEFLIIATGSFWNTINYQTAVDVARLKSDDALEASMVLRDFAIAYSQKGLFVVDEESMFSEEKYRLRKKVSKSSVPKRVRTQEPMTVMVINLRDWTGSKQKKPFTKIKRRKDETVDSGIARLAPEVEPPTGFVTIVFTDVRNSTTLWEKKPIAMRVAIKEHNQIMRRNLRNLLGYEVKTEGDAFMVSFKNVADALRWCITVQTQLLEADWPNEILESSDGQDVYGPSGTSDRPGDVILYRGLCIRMGVHCGSPVSEVDPITRRMDYFGPMVNKTSRICGAAEGGQILVSSDVEKAWKKLKAQNTKDEVMQNMSSQSKVAASEKVGNLMAMEPTFINVGEKKLKGFENPEPLISVLPKTLIGRHSVPPPGPVVVEKVDPNLGLGSLQGDKSAELKSRPATISLQEVAKVTVSPSPDISDPGDMSRMKPRRMSSSQTTFDGKNISPLHAVTDTLTVGGSDDEGTARKLREIREVSNLSRVSSTSNNYSEVRIDDFSAISLIEDQSSLASICERLENVSLRMVRQTIARCEKEWNISINSNSLSVPVAKRGLDTQSSQGDMSVSDLSEFVSKVEKVCATVHTLTTSSIIPNLAQAPIEERMDFLLMLQFLLSVNKRKGRYHSQSGNIVVTSASNGTDISKNE